ncbi:uncharacterized protein EAF02_006013 [Botrytis sinoallii]|uniref:uncharacterized protein n=1 Tax=Botrytis sinoallii TaxID=1463999 RepID=UPI001901CCC8|nr:uncharacterized protein EAF02_006013 [Botrytis sinoallii]KAF7882650.1 hypothetical protein EAF02_006013 [Botrytis sinoallii]
MASGDQFVDIDLHPAGATREQARRQRSMKYSVPSKKTKRSCYPIVICILIVIVALLGFFVGFLLIRPGIIGMPCSAQVNSPQASSPVHLQTFSHPFYNTTATTKQSTTKTNSNAQATATGTPSGIDPVAIATCLGVLENACATNNSQTTFGQCDSLFVFFYCDLTDMMVFRGAMKPDDDGMSPVCQPMKKFCSRAIPLNKIPLADASP